MPAAWQSPRMSKAVFAEPMTSTDLDGLETRIETVTYD